MTKANKFEIKMNKLDNVSGGSLVSENPLMQSALELERPSLAESRRPQLGLGLELGRPQLGLSLESERPTKAVLESYSDSKARLINPREW